MKPEALNESMTIVLEKSNIPELLENLSKRYLVVNYQKEKTVLSAKGYLLASREKLFSYFFKRKKIINSPKPKTPHQNKFGAGQAKLLLFGLDPIDIEAVDQLDEIMSKPREDYFYFQKRQNVVIIGVAEHSISVPVTTGDLILEKINENQYRASPLTKEGEAIAKNKFFKKEKTPQVLEYPEKENSLRDILKDSEILAEAVFWSRNHPIWDRLEKICLGCGICTYICPLCYCFSVEDEMELDGSAAHRCRYWDACTLSNFSQIAGGKNFRPSLKNRYYNWFYHKFVRAYKEFGKAQCVGCGRCQKYCPAGIDIEKVLLEIIKDYENEKSLSPRSS